MTRTLLQKGFRVWLIEAGGNLAVNRRPAEYPSLFGGPQDWSFSTTPQIELAGRRIPFPRGRGPGGSTRINAMIWYPPQECDWQMLNRAGGDAWAPELLEQSFKRVENWVKPELPIWVSPSTRQVLEICQTDGLEMQPYRRMAQRSKRVTAFDRLQTQWQASEAWRLIQATVKRIVFAGERAVGVEIETSSPGNERLDAEQGVILCGGAIASPQLLFASGIGARDELQDCGIDCRVDAAQVGKQLADHLLMPVIYHRPGERFVSGATVGEIARWDHLGTGPLASNLAEAGGVFTTNDGQLCQLHVTPTHYLLHPGERSPAALTLGVNLCCPDSRGQLQWHRDPETDQLQTLINPAYCTAASDRDALLSAIGWARQLGQPLQDRGLVGEELIPGVRRKSHDADWKAVARFSQTLYHPGGTCRMGVDSASVVDSTLAVRHVDRLWTIDASVLPGIVSVNPNALLMTLGQYAASEIE